MHTRSGRVLSSTTTASTESGSPKTHFVNIVATDVLACLEHAKQVVFFLPIIFGCKLIDPIQQIALLQQLLVLPWVVQQDFRAVLNLLFSLKRFCLEEIVTAKLIATVAEIFRARQIHEFQEFRRLCPGCSSNSSIFQPEKAIKRFVLHILQECVAQGGTVERRLQTFCHPGLESAEERSVREQALGNVIIVPAELASMASTPASFALGFHIPKHSRDPTLGSWRVNTGYATEEYAARAYLTFLYHGTLAVHGLSIAESMFVQGACCSAQAGKEAKSPFCVQTVLRFPGFIEPKTPVSAVLQTTPYNGKLCARYPEQPHAIWGDVAQEAKLKARVDRRQWVHTIQDVNDDWLTPAELGGGNPFPPFVG